MADVLQVAVNAASLGGIYALSATGIALIYGVMRLMNFAHGEVILVGAYGLLILADVPWPLMVLATIIFTAVVAMAIERLAYRPIRNASGETLLVTSFAVAACIQNLVILIVGSRPRTVSIFPSLGSSVEIAGVSIDKVDLLTFATTVIMLIALTMFLNRTVLGVQLRASSENFTMARLLGVKADRTILVAFAISGVLAGTVALLLAARTGNLFPTLGLTPIIFGFVATIMGGLGSIKGAVAGGFLLGAVQMLLQEVLPIELRPYRDAFLFAAVILVLLTRPQGILPTKTTMERV